MDKKITKSEFIEIFHELAENNLQYELKTLYAYSSSEVSLDLYWDITGECFQFGDGDYLIGSAECVTDVFGNYRLYFEADENNEEVQALIEAYENGEIDEDEYTDELTEIVLGWWETEGYMDAVFSVPLISPNGRYIIDENGFIDDEQLSELYDWFYDEV